MKQALSEDVNRLPWFLMAADDKEEFLEQSIQHFPLEERESLIDIYNRAQSAWTCKSCADSKRTEVVDKAMFGFVECSICYHWYHIKCCRNIDENDYINMSKPEDELIRTYVCETCSSFTVVRNASATDQVSTYEVDQTGGIEFLDQTLLVKSEGANEEGTAIIVSSDENILEFKIQWNIYTSIY